MSVVKHLGEMYERLSARAVDTYRYCVDGVWSDVRPIMPVKIIKTLNLSVRAFLDSDIQTKACALTYRTVLAIVPALALIFAIGRGFGLQDLIRDGLMDNFVSQQTMLEETLTFVDSYLSQSAGGVFVGVGIVLLLWTLISILGAIEHAFNDIWGVKGGRSLWRKITDYLTIFLLLPVLMICASGITVFVTSTAEQILPFDFVTPLMEVMLDLASLVMLWLFFTGVYMLVPTTKVKFRNAFGAGVFAGTAYLILQWLYVSGQIYVVKYNAVYGSIAFVPLFLIWVQLVWVITLTGAVVCFASQNIFRYNYSREISEISHSFRLNVTVSIMTIIVHRYLHKSTPPTEAAIAHDYSLPSRLVNRTLGYLQDCGLVLRVVVTPNNDVYGYVPTIDASLIRVSDIISAVRRQGASNFLPGYDKQFKSVCHIMDLAEEGMLDATKDVLVKDLHISTPDDTTIITKKPSHKKK